MNLVVVFGGEEGYFVEFGLGGVLDFFVGFVVECVNLFCCFVVGFDDEDYCFIDDWFGVVFVEFDVVYWFEFE